MKQWLMGVTLLLLVLGLVACGTEAVDPIVIVGPRSAAFTQTAFHATATPTMGLTVAPTVGLTVAQSAVPTPTAPAIATIVVRTRVVTPVAPLLTSTGKVKQIENVNNQWRLRLAPDDPAMRSEFMITESDWSRLTVLHYWAGLQTPTPVAEASKRIIAQGAVGREVTIGYYATTPPTIVLLSIHKKPGDPQ